MSDEVLEQQGEDQVAQGEEPTQDNEYETYLRAKGIDPSDLPKLVEAIKSSEAKVQETENRLRQVEWTANQLAQQQPRPAEPQDEDDNVKAWERWAKQNPDKVVTQLVSQQMNSARMADALDAVAESYMEKENGSELFEMLKPIAMQLVQSNPGHYAGPPRSSVRRVFKDAEEYLKRNASVMARIAGLPINEPGSQRTNAAMGAAAAGALGGANRQPLKAGGKEDQAAIIKRYQDASSKGDTDTMLELSLKHDWLAGKRPVNHWE